MSASAWWFSVASGLSASPTITVPIPLSVAMELAYVQRITSVTATYKNSGT
jgi:hypothetical protein